MNAMRSNLAATCLAFSGMFLAAHAADPKPVIFSPAAGTKVTQSPVDVRIKVTGIFNGNHLKIFRNGKQLGYARPIHCIGEWEFPNGSHLSVMTNDGTPPIIMDYSPPAAAPMYFFSGSFATPTRFNGRFEHWNWIDPDPFEGDVTVDFGFTATGMLTAAITGDSPLGTRNVSGGWSESTTYRFLWNDPPDGSHLLTAVANWTDPSTSETHESTSAAVGIQVALPKTPEIAVEQPAGKALANAKGTLNFGKVKARKTAAKTFVIRNDGTAKLKGLKVSAAGRNAKDFIPSQPRLVSLNPGGKTTFKVTFRPTKVGTRIAEIRVASNDADDNPFRIKVSGKGH